ncbi:hypothetical protein Tco_0213261 [Tanacetum coccineum]
MTQFSSEILKSRKLISDHELHEPNYCNLPLQRLLILADLPFWLLALDYLISEDVFVRVMIDEFVDQHNMVACLERTKENVEFHQIVDFLTTSSIHYALTQIHATVDGKTVVISESSVRNDLHFNDEDGDRHRCQEAIGVPLLRLGLREHLPGVNTPKSDEERNEQQDLTDFVPPTPHDSPLSGGHTLGSDEGRPNINELMVICINLSNRVLALEQSKTAQDLVLQKKVKRLEKALRARTPGMKLFKIGTSRRKGLDKENVSKHGRKSNKTKPMFKDSDFDVLDDAMENVEGCSIAEQITTAGDTLNTASINVSAAGPSTMIRNVKEEPRRSTSIPIVQIQDKGKCKMVEPEPTPKNLRKVQIQMDEELAQRMDADELLAARLQEQEREQFSVDEHARFLVETIAARKKFLQTRGAQRL